MKAAAEMSALKAALLIGCFSVQAWEWGVLESDCECLTPCVGGTLLPGLCRVLPDCPEAFMSQADGMHAYSRFCETSAVVGNLHPACDEGAKNSCLDDVTRTSLTGNEMDLMIQMCLCFEHACEGRWEHMPYGDGARTTGEVMQETILQKTGIDQSCTMLLQAPACGIECEGECDDFKIEQNSLSYKRRGGESRATLTFKQDAFYKFTKLQTGYEDFLEHRYCASTSAGYSCPTINRYCRSSGDCMNTVPDAIPIAADENLAWRMDRTASNAEFSFTCFRRCRVNCTGDHCGNIVIGSPGDLWARGTTRVSRDDYRDGESATLTFTRDGVVQFTKMETEKNVIAHDYLRYNGGIPMAGKDLPKRFHVEAGKSMEWFSDMQTNMAGWSFDYVCDLSQEI